MIKNLKYFVAGALSFFAVAGLSTAQTIYTESTDSTSCEGDLARDTLDSVISQTSTACPLQQQGTQSVLQQQIDAETEASEFFIGCGTVM